MYASKLNAAIRKLDKAPRMRFTSPCGEMIVEITKASMFEAIKVRSGGDRTFETGIYIDDNGFLGKESDRDLSVATSPIVAANGAPAAERKLQAEADLAEEVVARQQPVEDDDLLGDSPVVPSPDKGLPIGELDDLLG